MIFALAFLIGIIAGLRALTAPAMVSWAAKLGWLSLSGTWLAFLGYHWTAPILTVLAIGEIINDKLPNTPSRKIPPQFITRVLTGALSGAAIMAAHGNWILGAAIGGLGAVAGTLGGASFRGMLAKAFGKDLPAALVEDCIAVVGGILIVRQLL